ncbi:MAG TPA: hypothetical protein DER07_10105 [Armatimonadetes bacterium]|nr:hypothetical protein [Armatimonadota bacterium]
MQYHISRQGQTYGPYPAEDVKRMLSEGRLLPTDLCWTEGMAGWEPLGKVMAAAAPAVPPPQTITSNDSLIPPPPCASAKRTSSWGRGCTTGSTGSSGPRAAPRRTSRAARTGRRRSPSASAIPGPEGRPLRGTDPWRARPPRESPARR